MSESIGHKDAQIHKMESTVGTSGREVDEKNKLILNFRNRIMVLKN